MNSQNLILLGIGIFVSLIVGVAAFEQYMLNEHDPMHPDGLIWRVKTAFDRIKDLEAVVDISNEGGSQPTRLLVRLVHGTNNALSVRYLDPKPMRDELFTVSRDLLSHYIPQEDMIIVKRWAGFPLSDLGLSILSLKQLESDWKAGRVDLKVIRGSAGFHVRLFNSPLRLSETISGRMIYKPFSICLDEGGEQFIDQGIGRIEAGLGGSSIQGGFILEASDPKTGNLRQMVWIDPETFLVRKVVVFSDGKRSTSIELERLSLNQGLTPEEVLTLPRGVEVIHG